MTRHVMGGGVMGYMSHVSSVTREVELKISVLLILKTTLHVWFPKMAIFVKKTFEMETI